MSVRSISKHGRWLWACCAAMSACSLLAPTDQALTGGSLEVVSAGQASGAGAEPSGEAGAPAPAAGGDQGTSGTSMTAGSTAGGGGSVDGGTGGNTSAGTASAGTASAGTASAGTASAGTASAGTSGAGAGGGSCVSDVTSTRPKISSLSDDFSDGVPGPTFRLDGDGSCGVETKSQLRVTLPTPVASSYYCYFETTGSYDLTCDAIVLKVPEVVGPSLGLQTFLYVTADPAHQLMVLVENGSYLIGLKGENPTYSGRYSAAEPWWRLRETAEGGQRKLVFETSADAKSWMQRASLDRPFAVGSVKVALGAGAYQTNASPGSAAFACFNSPACAK